MEGFMKGDVVVINFPFTNLINSKKRPALIIANLKGDDCILCQISSKFGEDIYSVRLNKNNFKSGKLKHDSIIRPNKIFTMKKSKILYLIGNLKDNKITEIEKVVVKIISS